VTLKAQDAVRWPPSRVVHDTGVAPTANADPLAGWHDVLYGAVPPVTSGAG
jgi:hypothetical protein